MTGLSKAVCGELLWVWGPKSVLVQFQMQVSCLFFHPALALIRHLRNTAQMEELIGFALGKYKRPLMLFSLPSVPFGHTSYVMHLFTCCGLFGCLIAFVAKRTFFVLPVPIWIPNDPISTSFLRFD